MQLENPNINAYAPIQLEDAKEVLATGMWGENPALQLVIQDSIRAENYAQSKQWVAMWPTATVLYQSPFTARYWEGTQTEKANVPFFTVATAVNSLVPKIINGLFYEDPPFMIRQRPKTTANASRAAGAILAYQLEEINFKESLRLGTVNAVLFGTAIWKWGWETFTQERTTYKRKTPPVTIPNAPGLEDIQIHPVDEELEEEIIEEYIDRPTFEHIVNLRHVLVDPGLNLPDIRKGKYVIHRMYMTWEDLDKLRDRPGFNIPSKDKLLQLFFPPKEQPQSSPAEVTVQNPLWDLRAAPRYEETTEDPFNKPLEVLERWDNKRYIVVLNKKLVICSDENPYGVIPFLSVNWWDVPEAFWGMGLAKTIGSEQRLQQGVTNAWLDGVALNLNGVYVRVRGKSVPTQSIRVSPGKIVEVDNKDDFKPLDRLPAVPEAAAALSLSQARAEQVSGANEPVVQGSMGGPKSSMGRTATGASLIAGGSDSRIQDFVEKLANQVFIPFLYQAHVLNCGLLPLSTVRHILNDELEHEFIKEKQGDILEIINARVKFSISAGARLAARRNMAQSLPLILQYLANPQIIEALAVEGKKVDQDEIMHMVWETADWKNFRDVIKPMTPDDMKRWQSMQPGAKAQVQMQAKTQLEQQKFENESQLRDMDNFGRAGREILRSAIEKAGEPEAISGAPTGTQGFGSNV
jgi:hypothetical protein